MSETTTKQELAKAPKDMISMLNSDTMQKQFAAALPTHLSPERYCRIATTALRKNPALQKCSQESVFKCLLDLSSVGLEPDGRNAHLIPFKNECTLIIDYKGLVQLVKKSGEVNKIHADVVCEEDHFIFNKGEVTTHQVDYKKERGEAYAAYAEVTYKDGSTQAVVMSKKDIEGIRARSKAGKSPSSPWATDWDEMAKKTVFKRLCKWLNLSPEAQNVLEVSNEEFDMSMRNITPSENPMKTVRPVKAEAAAAEEAIKDAFADM